AIDRKEIPRASKIGPGDDIRGVRRESAPLTQRGFDETRIAHARLDEPAVIGSRRGSRSLAIPREGRAMRHADELTTRDRDAQLKIDVLDQPQRLVEPIHALEPPATDEIAVNRDEVL